MNKLKNNLSQTLSASQYQRAFVSFLDNYVNTPFDLLNSAQDFIVLYDNNLQVIWANKSVHYYMHNVQKTKDKANCADICGLNEDYCEACVVKQAIDTGDVCESERSLKDTRVLKIKAIPLKNEENKIIGVLEISTEIVESDRIKADSRFTKELVVRTNTEGKLMYVNPDFQKTLRHEPKSLKGKSLQKMLHPDDVPVFQTAMERMSLPPYKVEFESRLNTTNGVLWYNWTGRAIMDEQDEVTSYICIGKDISYQKVIEKELRDKNSAYEKLNEQLLMQNANYEKITRELLKRNNQVEELYLRLKESEERFRNMFVKHSSIMYLYDPESLEIIDANVAAQHFYGYTEDEFTTKTLMDLNVLPKDEIQQRFKKASDRNHHYVTFKHKLASGDVRDVEIYAVPIMYNSEELNFSIVYDVTKRKKAEKKLTESKKKLKEAIESKDKFFSIIAHDLKNPFNSLIGLTDFLQLNMENVSRVQLKDLVQTLGEVSQQGYNLLENLLQWSRTQTGNLKVVIEELDVNELMEETVMFLRNNASGKELEIILTKCTNNKAMGDAHMISTVIRNLLANAIKYSYRKGKIVLRCSSRNDKVFVSVMDEGQGIQTEDLDKLFRIDENLSTPGTEDEKGTGLGLTLCKEFIKRCKGELIIDSTPGKGSTFTFSLPAAV